MGLGTDIRVVEARAFFRTEQTEDGLAFGRQRTADLTLCHVRVRVESRRGDPGVGWGAIFLSHPWAMPQVPLPAEARDGLMRELVVDACERAAGDGEFTHPLDIFSRLRGERPVPASARGLAAPIPELARLVCLSPVDAAIHDAFGIAAGISSYDAYGPEHCAHDLAPLVGEGLAGRYAADFLREEAATRVPVAHTVGLGDSLTDPRRSDLEGPPRTLERWIARDGVYCFKVKFGGDIAWDLERLIEVHDVAASALGGRPIELSVDFNGQCPSVDLLVGLLEDLRRRSPATYAALRYVEQPTAPETTPEVRAASALKPMILDEAFTRLDEIEPALEAGWSGVAIKTCKGQSLCLLGLAAVRRRDAMCVIQDLSNVGVAFLQSVGLASRLPEMTGLEANARQYYPNSSGPETAAHPDVMRVAEGCVSTSSLGGPGLGYRVGRIPRDIFQEVG
ncbi:MAG TPA: enolase C-terminal domain-like protein [Candidatus Dormibacteraeota bacterium]|nr:enolase C-terminal domain-like protein [Candidatus Dormibacteraeota bacterium]